jgi:GGDEF domain-containing protein
VGQTVDDEVVKSVLALQPWVQSRPEPQRFDAALRGLVEAERCRRGAPDPVSGALHVSALTQGSLLKPEYDLSVHAHTGWDVSALTVDVKEMIHVNQEAGFAAGNRFLHTVADALAATFPRARVVRIHTDCFAVLFLPSGDASLTEADGPRAWAALDAAVAAFRAGVPALRRRVEFTIGGLSLRIRDPSHWQVLGPLLWGELERTHVLARRGDAPAIQRREIHLDGRVPAASGAATPRG